MLIFSLKFMLLQLTLNSCGSRISQTVHHKQHLKHSLKFFLHCVSLRHWRVDFYKLLIERGAFHARNICQEFGQEGCRAPHDFLSINFNITKPLALQTLIVDSVCFKRTICWEQDCIKTTHPSLEFAICCIVLFIYLVGGF